MGSVAFCEVHAPTLSSYRQLCASSSSGSHQLKSHLDVVCREVAKVSLAFWIQRVYPIPTISHNHSILIENILKNCSIGGLRVQSKQRIMQSSRASSPESQSSPEGEYWKNTLSLCVFPLLGISVEEWLAATGDRPGSCTEGSLWRSITWFFFFYLPLQSPPIYFKLHNSVITQ